jgi:hypothetical protein
MVEAGGGPIQCLPNQLWGEFDLFVTANTLSKQTSAEYF